jgi:predicted Zn-dependent peptidase
MTSRTTSDSTAAGLIPETESFALPRAGGTIPLHVLRTRRFKSLAFRLRFVETLDSHAAARNVLAGVLRRGSARTPSMRGVSQRLERLHGAGIAIEVSRFGERHFSDFTLHTVADRHLPRGGGNFAAVLDLLGELLLEPALEGSGFVRASFEQERTNLVHAIRAAADDKPGFALRRLIEEMFAGEPYARLDTGTADEALALDPAAALAFHRARLTSGEAVAFAAGDLDDAGIDAITRFLERLGDGTRPAPRSTPRPVSSAAARHLIEPIAANQTHAFVGYRLDPARLSGIKPFALATLVSILGGGAHSLLFREVREREGLAYSTHAALDRAKGFLFAYAGVAPDAGGVAIDSLRRQVDSLREGSFDDAALDAARAAIRHALRGGLDSPLRAIEYAGRAVAVGRPIDPVSDLARAAEVDRAAVMAAAALPIEGLAYIAEGSAA